MHKIWDDEDFPIHCPEHHFMMPAVLLTIYRRLRNDGKDILEKNLAVADERSRNLVPGACGLYGACGAAVGSGIFFSILTDTTPLSTRSWGQANRLTADCLHSIAEIWGPRCCKRVSYTTLSTTISYMKNNFGMDIRDENEIECKYHESNKECKRWFMQPWRNIVLHQ